MAEGEEGGVVEAEEPPQEEAANGEAEHAGAAEGADQNDESLFFIIKTCDGFQKVNFLMIFLVISGQLNKYAFDALALKCVKDIHEIGVIHEDHPDNSVLAKYNTVCMFIDSIIINLGAISLLKYSSLFVPQLEVIILTVLQFLSNTVKKTLLMISMSYIIFGLLSW